MNAEKRACGTCRHAMKLARPMTAAPGGSGIDLSQPQTYQCRRYPPQFILATQTGLWTPSWPSMMNEHWCGEHAPTLETDRTLS